MSREQDFKNAKETHEKACRERDKLEGAYKVTLANLKKEFEIKSLEEAEQLFFRLKKEEKKAQEEFDQAFNKYKEERGDKLCL